jgi:hypothetical protein
MSLWSGFPPEDDGPDLTALTSEILDLESQVYSSAILNPVKISLRIRFFFFGDFLFRWILPSIPVARF